jgi:hypothetical protein
MPGGADDFEFPVLAQSCSQRGKLLDMDTHHRNVDPVPLLLERHNERGDGEDRGRSTLLMQDLIHRPAQAALPRARSWSGALVGRSFHFLCDLSERFIAYCVHGPPENLANSLPSGPGAR